MQIKVTHSIGDLASDMRKVTTTTQVKAARVVRKNAVAGNRVAKALARESAGKHGKHYPNAFSADAETPLRWEYGPDSSKPQGGMSFENGSRNQKPHLDLARSADKQGPQFAKDIADMVAGQFWPT